MRDPLLRKTGAVLCSEARCPNKLGDSPYAKCDQHLPENYQRRRGEQQAALAATGSRTIRSQPHLESEIMSLLADGREWRTSSIRRRTGWAEVSVGNALAALLREGSIQKVRLGVYRESLND